MHISSERQALLFVGFTAVFIGYLSVWLPGPAAGLRLLGLELGEWIKFFGVGGSRDLFYLPPITLGLMLALVTVSWPNGRWQTWLMRGLAVAVSLFAFPSLEVIRFEPTSEWLLRLELIGLVILVAGLSGFWAGKRPPSSLTGLPWLLLALVGVAGAILPTWMYFTIRPLVSQAIGLPLGIGLGVWLNGLGHLLVTSVSLLSLKSV